MTVSSAPAVTCQRCGASWTPRVETPKLCPFCHSPYWRWPRKRPQRPSTERVLLQDYMLTVSDMLAQTAHIDAEPGSLKARFQELYRRTCEMLNRG